MDTDLIELEARCHGPSRYGDCARFAADYLRERTGDDLLGEWRDAEREEIIARFGSVPRAVLRTLRGRRNWSRVEPGEASGAVLGLAMFNGRGWACCVPVGGGWWATCLDEGLAVIPAEQVRRAWAYRQARA